MREHLNCGLTPGEADQFDVAWHKLFLLSHPFQVNPVRDTFERIQFSKIKCFRLLPCGDEHRGAKTGCIVRQILHFWQVLFSKILKNV